MWVANRKWEFVAAMLTTTMTKKTARNFARLFWPLYFVERRAHGNRQVNRRAEKKLAWFFLEINNEIVRWQWQSQQLWMIERERNDYRRVWESALCLLLHSFTNLLDWITWTSATDVYVNVLCVGFVPLCGMSSDGLAHVIIINNTRRVPRLLVLFLHSNSPCCWCCGCCCYTAAMKMRVHLQNWIFTSVVSISGKKSSNLVFRWLWIFFLYAWTSFRLIIFFIPQTNYC